MSRLGVSEHRWKGVPNDVPLCEPGKERLSEVVVMLKAGILNKNALQAAPGQQAPWGPATAAILKHLVS